MKKVTVLSKWSFVTVSSKAAVSSKAEVYSKAMVYKCKVVVYKYKVAVYTCKVLNSKFTTVLLRTVLDTVEVTSFLQICFCVKQWLTCVNQ